MNRCASTLGNCVLILPNTGPPVPEDPPYRRVILHCQLPAKLFAVLCWSCAGRRQLLVYGNDHRAPVVYKGCHVNGNNNGEGQLVSYSLVCDEK